jgi:hypothetical protein
MAFLGSHFFFSLLYFFARPSHYVHRAYWGTEKSGGHRFLIAKEEQLPAHAVRSWVFSGRLIREKDSLALRGVMLDYWGLCRMIMGFERAALSGGL